MLKGTLLVTIRGTHNQNTGFAIKFIYICIYILGCVLGAWRYPFHFTGRGPQRRNLTLCGMFCIGSSTELSCLKQNIGVQLFVYLFVSHLCEIYQYIPYQAHPNHIYLLISLYP